MVLRDGQGPVHFTAQVGTPISDHSSDSVKAADSGRPRGGEGVAIPFLQFSPLVVVGSINCCYWGACEQYTCTSVCVCVLESSL